MALFALACVVTACERNTTDKAVAESVTLPMEVSYKGTPEIGSMTNVQTVMEWNKRLSELNVDLGDLLADTVSFHLADGMEVTTSRDSAVAFLAGYVSGMSSIKINFTTALPVNIVDQENDEWVFSWTEETYTHKDGKVEHHFIHEDYFMQKGKIREVFQYARQEAAPNLASH